MKKNIIKKNYVILLFFLFAFLILFLFLLFFFKVLYPCHYNLKSVNSTESNTLSQDKINKIQNLYNESEKIAYLTFDDGPSKKCTPKILDILKKNNIKATFFVIGERVNKNPEIIKRAYEEGHYIANHTYSHLAKKIYISKESFYNEIQQTEKSIGNAIRYK